MPALHLSAVQWRTSSRSTDSPNCVATAVAGRAAPRSRVLIGKPLLTPPIEAPLTAPVHNVEFSGACGDR